ncbi:MAG: HNH endonuclease signature motif containing protein, partial [Pseudomonadota bacterium]
NKTESDNYKTFAGRPLEIYATSESDAISKYQDAIISTLELAEYEKISKVSGFKNVEVVDMSTGSVTHPRDIMMKASSHVSYNFIPNDESLLKKNDVLDMCVPTQFVGIYGDLIKKLTDEYFIKLCYQVRGEVQISNITQSRLDIDFCDDEDDDEPVMPTNQWTIADGVSPSMLCKICEILNISHYAYDFSNNCFLKNIATSRHYPVLCYYALSGHMYLVSNKDKIKSMIEKSKSIETRINSSTLARDSSNDNEKEDIYLRPILENIEIKDLMMQDKCTIIYPFTEINGLLDEIISIYNFIPIIFNHQQDIIKIHFTFGGKDIFLVADPSIDHTKEIQKMTWKTIQSFCVKLNLPFANQSYSSLISQLKSRFLDSKVKRHKFSKTERTEHHILAGGVCNICYVAVSDKEFELDHVIPLASGGTNEDENIVVLCKGCHSDKTKCEKTETGYVKLSNTESSFNKITKEIFNSALCNAYAFVEKRADPKQQGAKVYHIDINKSRKNNMLFSNYDYPLFTVMDSVVPYTNQTGAGYYYVESDSYFPIRCNGWYLFPTIDYCLKENIIKSSDIKYTIQASLTISPEHYNEFISYLYTNMGEFAKLGVNSMIGCFKMKAREQWKSQQITDHLGEAKFVQISTSANEALKKFIDLQGSVITTRCINNKKYYQVYNKYLSERDETEAIIYQQIVEVEAIELHKLTKIIEARGGQVLDLNTDCVSCCFKNNVFPFKMIDGSANIEGFFWNDVDMVIPSW